MTRDVQSRRGDAARSLSTGTRLAKGLGWFSIGLGLAEVIAPGAVAGLIGVRRRPKTRAILRLYGLRELAAGVGILTQPQAAGWLWARVAGDGVDLLSLLSAASEADNSMAGVALGIASVAGVTAADIYCAGQLSGGARRQSTETKTRVIRTIIIGRPTDEVYNFWRDFENLPRFMTYLESVHYTGDRRTHWIANGPAGSTIEWDAETISDEPNRRIAWRSLEGTPFDHSGSVSFEREPANRGTLVRVDLDFSHSRGASAFGKVVQMDIGRRIMHDLRNFKQVLEVGEVTQSEASMAPGMHAAQPEPAYQH